MPIKGTFTADFTSFQAAVEQANVTLGQFQAKSSIVEKQLNTMANALSGTKLIADATVMAEAVERIGGVSKLTEAELARLAGQAAEAVEKMKALGMDVPEHLQAIADHANEAQPAVEGLGARVTGLVQAASAAIAAFDQLVGVINTWVASSNASEDATVRMTSALRAQGSYTPELAAQYLSLASQFEKTTVNADELVVEMEALLTTVGNVAPKDMEAALTASSDLAAGLRIDLTSATQLVAKALEGNTTALHRHGIEIDSVKLQTEGASAVFDAIAAKMGGAATAQAATFGGEMKRLGNIINNVEESFGGFIANTLQPLIDRFVALPEPVRTGIIAVGLLGTAAVALAAAVSGVAAAVALAAPLLGFEAAGLGAAAVAGLGTAATTAAAAFGPLALAIGAVWAAWKLGNTETVKNSIAEWALSSDNLTASVYRSITGLEQMTPEQAKAAVAATAAGEAALKHAEAVQKTGEALITTAPAVTSYTELLAATQAQVAGLSEAEVAEILAAKELGASQKELEDKFHLNAAALTMLTQAHTQAVTEAKKFDEAMGELNAAGTGYAGTLATINGDTVEAIKYYLDAGVAQDKLTTAYGLTATQVKAVATEMKDEQETAKLETKILEQTTTLWDQYFTVRVQHGGTATDRQIADINRWYEDTAAKLTAMGAFNAQTAEAAAAVWHAKLDGVMVDWTDVNQHSKQSLQEIADKARATADYVLANAGNFTADYVRLKQQEADEAERAAYHWRDTFEAAAESVTTIAKQTSAQVIAEWDKVEAAAKKARESLTSSVTYDLSTPEGFQQFQQANPSAAINVGPEYFKTHTLQDAIAAGLVDLYAGFKTLFGGTGVLPLAGRASGGSVSAGTPYVVGEQGPELFVPPSSGLITPHGAGAVYNLSFHIVDTESEIARRVSDQILRTMRMTTQMGSA